MLNITSFDVLLAFYFLLARCARCLSKKLRRFPLVSPIPGISPQAPCRLAQLHKMTSLSTTMPTTQLDLFQISRLVRGAPATPARHGFSTLELTLFFSMGCTTPNRALRCVLSRFLRVVRLRKLNSTNLEGAPQRHVYLQSDSRWSKRASLNVSNIPACW